MNRAGPRSLSGRVEHRGAGAGRDGRPPRGGDRDRVGARRGPRRAAGRGIRHGRERWPSGRCRRRMGGPGRNGHHVAASC